MTPADPLQALHPLREPPEIGWWPPAPGWWLLCALLLFAFTGTAWLIYCRYSRNAYRRQGLLALQSLHEQYRSSGDLAVLLTGVNALLKSVALRAWPRRDIAALSGTEWLLFLNSSAPPGPRFEPVDVTAQYRHDPGKIDEDRLYSAARHWIRRHGVKHA